MLSNGIPLEAGRLRLRDHGWAEATLLGQELDSIEAGLGDGVKGVTLSFLDGTVAKIVVLYNDDVKWINYLEFQNRITESLSLPDAWEFRHLPPLAKSGANSMKCQGFRVDITYLPATGTMIRVSDDNPPRIVAERQKAVEAKRRATFKP